MRTMYLDPIVPCVTSIFSTVFSTHKQLLHKKNSKRSKCVLIFSHVETYIKYLPHVEEISEAEFIVTALNTSERGTARSLGEDDARLLSFSEQAPPAWRRVA